MTILHGDCRTQLATLPDNSVDAIVTDPPYELGFMGKRWDASGIAYDHDVWTQCLRVLKPGGHLLAFGGTRTYHRMTVAIEDAGFEIRDSLHWLYGSGFPKSLDVSKAIDKQRDDRADMYRVTEWVRAMRDAAGITNRDIDNAFGFAGMAGHWTSAKSQPAVPYLEQIPTLLDVLGLTLDQVPDDIRDLVWALNGRKGQPGPGWWEREITGTHVEWTNRTNYVVTSRDGKRRDVASTERARAWTGWGTALKPAHEPIVLARKPLTGTVAANVMEYGTGALNIDGTRIGMSDTDRARIENATWIGRNRPDVKVYGDYATDGTDQPMSAHPTGRWPANIILTHSPDCADNCAPDCPIAILDHQSGWQKDGTTVLRNTTERKPSVAGYAPSSVIPVDTTYGGEGGASRYFATTTWDPELDVPFLYVAKPSRAERNAGLDGMTRRSNGFQTRYCTDCGRNIPTAGSCGHNAPIDVRDATPTANFHPTVKPVALIRYLIRLITPPDGVVLDPFLGSGTTAVAAIFEGRQWIGCELTDDYLPIIEARTAHARTIPVQQDLFA